MDQPELTARQFGSTAAKYLTSAVHATGAEAAARRCVDSRHGECGAVAHADIGSCACRGQRHSEVRIAVVFLKERLTRSRSTGIVSIAMGAIMLIASG